MKSLLVLLTLLQLNSAQAWWFEEGSDSSNTASLSTVSCQNAIANFLNIPLNANLRRYKGTNQDGACTLDLSFTEEAGDKNLEIAIHRNTPSFDNTPFVRELSSILSTDTYLAKTTISKCKINGNTLTLSFTSKENFSWHKKESWNISLTKQNNKIFSSSINYQLHGSMLVTGVKESANCTIR